MNSATAVDLAAFSGWARNRRVWAERTLRNVLPNMRQRRGMPKPLTADQVDEGMLMGATIQVRGSVAHGEPVWCRLGACTKDTGSRVGPRVPP